MPKQPLFASNDLAARLERAEVALIKSGVKATQRLDPDCSACAVPVGGGVAAFAGDNSPFNKVAGLGFSGPPQDSDLTTLRTTYAERKAPVQVELSTLADPTWAPALTGASYALVGFENVLGTSISNPSVTSSDIEIESCETNDIDDWLDVFVTGFMTPDGQGVPSHESFEHSMLKRALRTFAHIDSVTRFVARIDGAIVGSASMCMNDGVAILCGAATIPSHRRRGVQAAFLERRLALAHDQGCDVAIVTTAPGSKSQQNVQRRGFQLLYSRAILTLDTTTATHADA